MGKVPNKNDRRAKWPRIQARSYGIRITLAVVRLIRVSHGFWLLTAFIALTILTVLINMVIPLLTMHRQRSIMTTT
jgi:hypothetical protein